MKQQEQKPVDNVRPYSYQPSKAELEEIIQIDATPDEIVRALFRQVHVAEDSSS